MDIGIFVPLIAVAIPLVAVGRRPFERWLESRERIAQAGTGEAAGQAAASAAKIARLENRVAVLERILTDRRTHLADEIDALRDPAR
jgi:hypothetical protein